MPLFWDTMLGPKRHWTRDTQYWTLVCIHVMITNQDLLSPIWQYKYLFSDLLLIPYQLHVPECTGNVWKIFTRNESAFYLMQLLTFDRYACSRFLMTPYRVADTPQRMAFNRALCRTRVHIECTFGRWKRRFGILHGEVQNNNSCHNIFVWVIWNIRYGSIYLNS